MFHVEWFGCSRNCSVILQHAMGIAPLDSSLKFKLAQFCMADHVVIVSPTTKAQMMPGRLEEA
jgi:hypothetical protein